MFVILLKFTERKDSAAQLLAAHNEWIQRGFDEKVFVLVGGLRSRTGGAILAVNTSMEALQARVNADPFVAEGIVIPDIEEIVPNRVDERLGLLEQ